MNHYIKHFIIVLLIVPAFKMAGQTPSLSKFVLDIHVAPTISGLNSDKYGGEESYRMGFTGGFDIAYYCKSFGKLNTGISAGLNYSRYNAKRELNYSDSLWTTDADNEQVFLSEKGDNLTEKQKAGFIDIPVLLRFNYAISPDLEVYMNAGAFFSVVISKKYNTSVSYTAKGYYPDYNVTLYNIDVDGSPYFYPTGKAMTDNGSLDLKGNIGIVYAIGVKYRITPTVALTAGLNTYMGLKNISGYNNTTKNSLVSPDQKIKTLMERGDKIKTYACSLQLGVAINLARGNK